MMGSMTNKKIHVAFYSNGNFKLSTKKIEGDGDDSIRVTMTPLVEMTEKQQEEALMFFRNGIAGSSADFKKCGVMVLGDVVLKIAQEFIATSEVSL
jgi:hypothetical protein